MTEEKKDVLLVERRAIMRSAVFTMLLAILGVPCVAQSVPSPEFAPPCFIGDPSVNWYNALSDAERVAAIDNYRSLLTPTFDLAAQELGNVFPGPKFKTSSRLKSTQSIEGKFARKTYNCFSDMKDVIGLRAIIPDYLVLPAVETAVNRHFKVEKEDKKLDPSPNSEYRAVHYDVLIRGVPAELQIHTRRSTLVSDASHLLVYKGPYSRDQLVRGFLMQLGYAVYQLDMGHSATIPSVPSGMTAGALPCLTDLVTKLQSVATTGVYTQVLSCTISTPPPPIPDAFLSADLYDVVDLIQFVGPIGG